jgi:hypothetical protein
MLVSKTIDFLLEHAKVELTDAHLPAEEPALEPQELEAPAEAATPEAPEDSPKNDE